MGTARQAYLDRVRGVAVLIMIEAHVLDSWTRPSDRASPLFGYGILLGGMGAPLFLFLAGVAVVLAAESRLRKSGDHRAAWRSAQRRGWQIFGLAFLFRFQSYILGGAADPAGLLKVDILNIMGPAMAATAFIGESAETTAKRFVAFAAAATAIAMLTPIVRAADVVGWLPDPVEWYLRPYPGRTNFTLFPWAGFVLAGAAAGLAIDKARASGAGPGVHLRLASFALVLGGLAYGASFLPSIYARSEFWTSSPTFFFLRVSTVLAALPLAYWWDRLRVNPHRWSALEELGRASLFVYWVHVEMVYGFLSRPFRRSLSLGEVAAGYAILTMLLLGLVLLKNRLIGGRTSPAARSADATAPSI